MGVFRRLTAPFRTGRREAVSETYTPPEAGRVLVVSPHPDDEVIGCGGSLALYRRAAAEVLVVMLTDGGGIALDGFVKEEIDDVPGLRREEALRVSRVLDVEVTFLGLPDGGLPSRAAELKEALSGVIAGFRPEIVYIPSIIEPHPDHRTAAWAVLGLMDGFSVAMYEVGSPLRYNTLVEITPVLELKREAMMQYRYSTYTMPETFWEAVRGLNAYRSMLTLKRGCYEAFLVYNERPAGGELIDWFTYGLRP